ncbi:ATP-binding cassette domain-containing protein [Mycoplasma sp. P36-A1]|uniref:ATP-binding cassette domain-containing protein n=1 Tax=Mycoplasma sp. P36-A1 TaxID=3252900 RepID=UPI003C2CB3D1
MKIFNLKRKYKNFELDIEMLELKDKQINCLIGDNGSGKSTLLKAIIKDENTISSKTLMLQKPYIFKATVQENLEIIKKLTKSEIDIIEISQKLNLFELLKQQALTLSGGQKQRLAFAMSIISDRDLILLDEPFNNVDLKSLNLMLSLLENLDKTILLVSHKILLSKKIGEHFILIENGKLNLTGNKEEFFNQDNKTISLMIEME